MSKGKFIATFQKLVYSLIHRIKVLDTFFWWIGYRTEYLAKIRQPGFRKRILLFYPERPAFFTTIRQLCYPEGVDVTTNPNAPFDASIYWKDATYCELDSTARQILKHGRMINSGCLDISKTRVDAAHRRAFGYNLELDPATHVGVCIRKSNKNYTHDGHMVHCPISREEVDEATRNGFAFFKLINNAVRTPDIRLEGSLEDYVEEFRVPYFAGNIPVCYRKCRPAAVRFTSNNTLVELVEVDAIFSAQEIDQIAGLCKDMQFDYGELDVLRDMDDGRIYVVDVNTTPWGPPVDTSTADEVESFRRLGAALISSVFAPCEAEKAS